MFFDYLMKTLLFSVCFSSYNNFDYKSSYYEKNCISLKPYCGLYVRVRADLIMVKFYG
jgi:hypothetical protein